MEARQDDVRAVVQLEVQVVLGRPRVHVHLREAPRGRQRRERRLEREQHLKERVEAGIARRAELREQRAKRQAVVRKPLERHLAGALQEVAEGDPAREVEAQHDGAQEVAQELLRPRNVPARGDRADGDVVLPGVARELRGERGEEHLEQRHLMLPGEISQAPGEPLLDDEGMHRPAEAEDRGPRPVDDGHAVEDDVAERQVEAIALFRHTHEPRAEQRRAIERDRPRRVRRRQPGRFRLPRPRFEWAQVVTRQLHAHGVVHDLDGRSLPDLESRPPGLVTRDDLPEAALERRLVQRAVVVDRDRLVVDGNVRSELRVEPDQLLAERQGHGLAPIAPGHGAHPHTRAFTAGAEVLLEEHAPVGRKRPGLGAAHHEPSNVTGRASSPRRPRLWRHTRR